MFDRCWVPPGRRFSRNHTVASGGLGISRRTRCRLGRSARDGLGIQDRTGLTRLAEAAAWRAPDLDPDPRQPRRAKSRGVERSESVIDLARRESLP